MNNKAIYIATGEANSGKSIVALGLMRMLLGKTAKVGYFRPIIDDDNKKDNHIKTVISHFDLAINYEDAYAFKRSELIKKLNKGKQNEIINEIIVKYKSLEEKNDFVLVEGTDFLGEGAAIELDVNILIAKNLGVPVIIVSSGVGKNLENFIEGLYLTYDSFKKREVEVLAVVANKVQEKNIEIVKKEVSQNLPKDVSVNVIPLITSLDRPTIKEIAEVIDADVLFGKSLLNNQAGDIKIGAMQLSHFLNHLTENSVTITPGDRSDILLGMLQANISSNYPALSGIILSGGFKMDSSVVKLIEGLEKVIPILSAKGSTFEVAAKVGAVRSHMYAENKEKIQTSLAVFEKYVDVSSLNEKLISFKKNGGITPRMFQYNLVRRAKKQRKHIVLPEGTDDRILIAASQLQKMDVVDITILGNKLKIEKPLTDLE